MKKKKKKKAGETLVRFTDRSGEFPWEGYDRETLRMKVTETFLLCVFSRVVTVVVFSSQIRSGWKRDNTPAHRTTKVLSFIAFSVFLFLSCCNFHLLFMSFSS